MTFEVRRKEIVEELINRFRQEHQRSLKGLQFKIDMVRRKSKNPVLSCIRLSNMMNEMYYYKFCPAFGGIASEQSSNMTSVQERKKGDVIAFKNAD